METALASQTSTLPLKALYSDFLNNFPLNVKAGDTLPSNPWAQALKTRVTDTLGELAERYDLKLNPLAAVGAIRVKGGQYINFCKKPLKTSRGFYPYIWFSFDNKNVGYALGFSDDNDIPKTFIETLSTVGRKRLPDFTESSRQGLPQKTINLEQTTDEELTSDLIRLLDTYTECINQLEDEIEEFISNTRTNQLTGSLTPEQLEVVLDEFIAWCEANPADQHLLDERPVAYANWSKEYFSNLPAADLVKEMTDFVAQGGKLQTGGARGKTKFAKKLSGREEEFRAHLTKAYDPNLDLEQWWEDSRAFPGFGQGIRSIFLHRAHPTHYAIYNQKALDGYRILGVLPTRSKRSQVSYTDVNTAAHTILAKRPDKLSLYLVDHLTHFITIPQGEALIQSLLNSNPEQGDDIAQECYKTWIIAGGERGRATQSFIQTNSISIDFDIRQDLTQFNTEQKIRTIIATAHNTTLDRHSWTSSCYSFAHKMKVGDLVILRSGLREINAVGVVTSRCTYQSHRETFPHVRQVEWVFVGERVLPDEIPQFRQATFVELTPDSPRVEAIKQLTNWTEFEAKISEIRAKVILAAPFLKIFLDREEAHTAFNLIKDTLERLEERDPQSDRLALTLPNAGSQISLSYGARLLLHLRRDEGQLVISSVLQQHDLATGEHFEGGEFSANGKGVGIGLKHRLLADFEQSEQHKQRYLSAVEALKTLSDHRTPYARWHIPQLVEAALDPAARENLFTNGLNNFATEQPYSEQSISIPTEKQMAKGRNVIYFGPPGTGKTWTLLNKERQRFIAPASSISKDEQLKALVADQPWWVVLGAALLKMGPSNVPALKQHPLVKARFAITDIKAPSSSLWVPLQMHTAPDSDNVALATSSRVEPFIFKKSHDSVWSLNEEVARAEAPEVIALAEAIDREAAIGEEISRYEAVTFHQSFSYEDFIEGIKPSVASEGTPSLGYEIQPGVFKRLCDRARADKEHEYAIFIDEINRGNVASIFGELISLIEEDKREGAPQALSVRLPYSKELFSVPANVSIIGTMNSADRSVEALDSALRRRFSFIELAPSLEPIRAERIAVEGIDIPRLFEVINQRLEKLLNRDHQIGHAYFLELKGSNASLAGLRALFQRKIIPLLQEYFYSDLGRIGLVLGSAFVEPVNDSELASFNYFDTDRLHDRQIYRLKDPALLTIEDFRSIYGS